MKTKGEIYFVYTQIILNFLISHNFTKNFFFYLLILVFICSSLFIQDEGKDKWQETRQFSQYMASSFRAAGPLGEIHWEG